MKKSNINFSKMAVPVGVVGIIMLLIVPIPAGLLDFLLIISILLSLVTLLTTMFVKKPLDFSVFPSLLLVATMFRLGLNVASTRLVLGQAHAGQVIAAFGKFTVSGSMIIGCVIFLLLAVIQFVVITKGAERVAEVGARFTLDAMPGKQMAIDADLNAGLITDEQAKQRRAEVSSEADFYGAMDGASKFVKGDAIAGIIIIVINLVGGIAIGMLQRGMAITDALNTYALLTIGDGLVTQIPALLMAISTGMIVTRSNASSDLGTTAASQLTQSRTALLIAGIASIIMGFLPGMPIVWFLLVGVALIIVSRRIKDKPTDEEIAARDTEMALEPKDPTEELMEQMRVHPLEILLAPDLVDLVSGASDDLLARVRTLRHKLAMDLGIVIPPCRTRDSMDLPASTYSIRIAGVEAGRGRAPGGRVLALGDGLDHLPGESTTEPVFGLAGKWVPTEMQHSAEMSGATVIDRVSVLITHLSAIVTDNAPRLLTREDVRTMTEGIRKVSPSAVEELIPGTMSLAEVQRVLQGLLAEQVPINDLTRIFESLTLRAKETKDPEALIEAAREGLGPALAKRHLVDGGLRVITLDPLLEQSMLEGLRPGPQGAQISMDMKMIEGVLTSVSSTVNSVESEGAAVLVCAPALRPALKRFLSAHGGAVPVLSYQEAAAPKVKIDTVGVVRNGHAIDV